MLTFILLYSPASPALLLAIHQLLGGIRLVGS
jgi:hypothetical protein